MPTKLALINNTITTVQEDIDEALQLIAAARAMPPGTHSVPGFPYDIPNGFMFGTAERKMRWLFNAEHIVAVWSA